MRSILDAICYYYKIVELKNKEEKRRFSPQKLMELAISRTRFEALEFGLKPKTEIYFCDGMLYGDDKYYRHLESGEMCAHSVASGDTASFERSHTVLYGSDYDEMRMEFLVNAARRGLKKTIRLLQGKYGVPDVTMIVNKDNPLSSDYVPTNLVTVSNNCDFASDAVISRAIAGMYMALRDCLKERGINVYIEDGYRSYDTQEKLLEYFIEKDGKEAALMRCALPGTSEHQTGLAIDLSIIRDGKDADMSEEEARIIEETAPNFGFVVRYPRGKEDITGYQYEPWHLRYVGIYLAKYLLISGLTLEEYYQKQKDAGKGSK